MNRIVFRVGGGISAASLAVAALVAAGVPTAIAEESPSKSNAAATALATIDGQADSAGGSTGSPGLKVYIDPETGEFATPPPGVFDEAVGPRTRPAVPREELRGVPAPGGGVMVDLKGHFRSYSVATQSPEGKIETNCFKDAEAAEEAVERATEQAVGRATEQAVGQATGEHGE